MVQKFYLVKQIDDSNINIIIKATENGSLRPQIATLVGFSKTTVYKYQKKLGLL